MRWILFGLLGLFAVGCGETCDVEGATRCADANVETCDDGRWIVSVDCVAAGQECMQDASMMEGEAHCMAGM